MMDVLLGTRNQSKAAQIQALFEDSKIRLRTLDDLGIKGEAVEDGDSLEANSLKKALFAHDGCSGTCWSLAEDTGIFINALDGEPGVRSARWLRDDATTEETMRYCLSRMLSVTDRSALFCTVATLVSPAGQPHTFTGQIGGYLLREPRCAPQPKMPYSPLFVPFGEKLAWAEMTTAHENAISHRGRAIRQVRVFLENLH